MPSENQVYADSDGNIGWIAAGRIPLRTNWDGLLPVPGDGRYEWKGYLTLDDLPRSFNPAQGWLATANEMNLPKDYPISIHRVGFDRWADVARFNRISEVLSEKPQFSLADAMALQNDDISMHARRLISLLKPLVTDDPLGAKAFQLVKAWDAKVSEDSAAAAIFEVWISKHLRKAVVGAATPAPARALIPRADIAATIDLLEHPDARLGSDPNKARDRLLIESLVSAAADVSQRLGPDPATWAWGKLHRANFVHALAPLADEPTKAQFQVGPLSMGGTSNVLHAATYGPDFTVTHGASFRMVLDVGNWDQSRTINAPGQSGNLYSSHYRDLVSLWATGEYVPLLYSREAVEGAASERWQLTPKD
jgi:penicillin amidase